MSRRIRFSDKGGGQIRFEKQKRGVGARPAVFFKHGWEILIVKPGQSSLGISGCDPDGSR
jgi:hypothetical protein